MFFDSHAHLDDHKYDQDRDSLISGLKNSGISNVINIGADMSSSKSSIRLAEKYDFIYASVGVHPEEVSNLSEDDMSQLKNMSSHEKVVAIGEIGLDYYYDDVPKDIQKKWFVRQIELANEVNLPIIIHSRDAAADTIDILKQNKSVSGGVMHCFSCSVEIAKIVLDLGYYISFAGPLTFKNSRALPDVARYVPIDRVLVETDSPYLSPEPFRGKRNSSEYVRFVCEKLAEIKGISVEEMAKMTSDNTKKLFKIN